MGDFFGFLGIVALVSLFWWICCQSTTAPGVGKPQFRSLAEVDEMDGIEFEYYVADLMRHVGFSNVTVSKASGDFGADVIASKGDRTYAVQVKRHKGSVSRRAVSDAVGAKAHYSCNEAMVVTNSYLTKQAMQFAKSVGCVVVDRDVLGNWVSRFQLADKPRTSLPAKKVVLEVESATPQERMPTVDIGSVPLDRTFMPGREGVPEAVFRKLKALAAKQYRGDQEMESYKLESEVDAYRAWDGFRQDNMPDEIFATVRRKLAKAHPSEYSVQLSILEDEVEAYEALRQPKPEETSMTEEEYDALRRVLDKAHPFEFRVQKSLLEDQLDAFKKLKDCHGADFGVSDATLGRHLHEVKRKYAGDYALQLSVLTSALADFQTPRSANAA
jgi:hypothetical protein